MQLLSSLSTHLLIFLPILVSAVPLIPPNDVVVSARTNIQRRQDSIPQPPLRAHCANYPSTIAGTNAQLSTRSDSLSSLLARDLTGRGQPGTLVWCSQASRTYLVVRLTRLITDGTFSTLLSTLQTIVLNNLQAGGGVIPPGTFQWQGSSGLTFSVSECDNQQITWAVGTAIVQGLISYMQANGYGAAEFTVYFGPYQIGTGSIQ